MKCALSEVDCSRCKHSKGTECEIYAKWYVVRKQLKTLRKHLDDASLIIGRVAE